MSARVWIVAASLLSVALLASGRTAGDAEAAAHPDLSACSDAQCEIVVSGTVDVPIDPGYGFDRITVSHLPPDRVTFDAGDPSGGYLHGEVQGGGTVTLNGLTIEALGIDPSGAVLRFTP